MVVLLPFGPVRLAGSPTSEQAAARLLAAALLASATAYLVQTQFNPSGLVATVIFWLALGIGCGLSMQTGKL